MALGPHGVHKGLYTCSVNLFSSYQHKHYRKRIRQNFISSLLLIQDSCKFLRAWISKLVKMYFFLFFEVVKKAFYAAYDFVGIWEFKETFVNELFFNVGTYFKSVFHIGLLDGFSMFMRLRLCQKGVRSFLPWFSILTWPGMNLNIRKPLSDKLRMFLHDIIEGRKLFG